MSKIILDACFKIHTRLGPGWLETVYEVVLAHGLRKAGVVVERQVAIPIRYDELVFDQGFRADLIVNAGVIVELKPVESLSRVHSQQVRTELRLGDKKLGLLIYFGELHLKNGIERIANGLPDKSRPGFGGEVLSFIASFALFA